MYVVLNDRAKLKLHSLQNGFYVHAASIDLSLPMRIARLVHGLGTRYTLTREDSVVYLELTNARGAIVSHRIRVRGGDEDGR